MKKAILLLSLCLLSCAAIRAGEQPLARALNPVPRNDAWWRDKQAANRVRIEQGGVDLLLLGDSIVGSLDGAGRKVQEYYYGDRSFINMGFGGDRTQHVLWRLDHLPMDKIRPKAVMLLIGSNNLADRETTDENIAEGIKACVDKLRSLYPDVKILVLDITPDGFSHAAKVNVRMKQVIPIVHELLKAYQNLKIMDVGHVWCDANGDFLKAYTSDGCHPNAAGCAAWLEWVEPTMAEWLGGGAKKPLAAEPPPVARPATPAHAGNAPVVAAETKEHKDARMAWWREAKFGMFIHWGLYSVPGGYYHDKPVGGFGEWIMNKGKIPVAEYADFAKQFNPVKFNADEWVKIVKDAGMKYIVITAKHHEGFAMFHTKVDEYNIYDATPFKRDPIAELAAACRKQGIKLGLYYSQNLDWHHPGGGTRGNWDPAQAGDVDKYVDGVVIPQLKELLTQYGDISVLWFDIPGWPVDNKHRPERIYKAVMECRPDIIMNDRLGCKGDTATPEGFVPAQGYPGKDWETCMTINNTWGYRKDSNKFQSTEDLLRNLIDIASKGGNYLLNVGPDAEGVIPAGEVQPIAAIGKWLKVNGEAIYGTSTTLFGEECGAFSDTEKEKNGKPAFKQSWDWRCTVRPGKTYIHILKWPGAAFSFDTRGKLSAITKAYLLADPKKEPLQVTMDGIKLTVKLPAQAPDPIASVLVLVLETAAGVR